MDQANAASIAIPLTRGMVAFVDAIDADLAALAWQAVKSKRTWYARRSVVVGDARRQVFLHRVVAARKGIEAQAAEIDHQDGDGLNCRRSNLRAATSAQNKWNQRRRKDNSSGDKGVCQRRGKWRAQISIDGKRRHLGDFATREEASAAYREAATNAFGEFARLE